MKTAHYHQEGKAPMPFAVLAENEDGTIDLANEAGVLVVGKCPVDAEAKPGHATIEEAPKDIPLASRKVDELREMAVGLGLDVAGLKKKDDFIAAIEAKQKSQ